MTLGNKCDRGYLRLSIGDGYKTLHFALGSAVVDVVNNGEFEERSKYINHACNHPDIQGFDIRH